MAGENGTCCVGGAVGCDVANGFPAGSLQSVPNRWGVAVQALTGGIQPGFSCASMNRSGAPFLNQYSISSGVGGLKAPYDYQYYLPFHRPISIDSSGGPAVPCAYTPYALPGVPAGAGVGAGAGWCAGGVCPSATNAADCAGVACTAEDFPADAIGTYPFQTVGPFAGQTQNNAASCNFSVAPTGAIQGASQIMRFGLMTFDNDPGVGIGSTYAAYVAATSPLAANTVASVSDGQWSYFAGWSPSDLGAGANKGWPAGCSTSPFFEVGARNPAAPPWEGRLMKFPNEAADTTATIESNQNVQLAISSMRPYGATPTAGLFDDAQEYLWHDPAGPQHSDVFVSGGCRQQFIILLTDGQPNLDLGVTPTGLTGSCTGVGSKTFPTMAVPPAGECPYQPAWQTAAALYGNGVTGVDPVTGRAGNSITTYVIGFAVSQNITGPLGVPIANCSALAKTGALYLADCPSAVPTDSWYPCCQLQQIAAAGQALGVGQAYFADTPGDLNAALGAVLGQIAKQLTSKTLPVYSPSVSYSTTNTGSTSTFLTSFNGGKVPWTGDIQRQRLICQGSPLTPTPQNITPALGDDFDNDVQQDPPTSRKFLAFQLPTSGDLLGKEPGLTLRPYLSAPTDGLAAFGGGGGAKEVGLTPAQITTAFTHLALNTTTSSCEDPTTHIFLSADDCANVAMQFAMAQPTVATSVPSFNSTYAVTTSRCPAGGGPAACNPIGAILHSTPAYTTPPVAPLRDDSYQAYSTLLAPGAPDLAGSNRPPTLFVATTDGLLHAFDTSDDPTDPTSPTVQRNNELWSFIPPGVFPNLISNYPAASSVLLDGAPITKDVIWERDLGGNTATWTKAWHTMLVAGYGPAGRGYYALDVTDPRSGVNFSAVTNFAAPPGFLTGPHFQWQIASMNPSGGPYTQNELFGTTSGTPNIATVFADPLTGTLANAKEIGVAILPGGSNGPPFAGVPCSRELVAAAGSYVPAATYNSTDPAFGYRSQVRRWSKDCRVANGPNSGVPGRSVTIVRIDTGDILAVFARPVSSSPDTPSSLLPGKLIAAPFDSPMTGTPIVYPSGVGAIAQEAFIGDADGTMWRIDLTSPDPTQWRAAMFFDSYNSVVDNVVNLADPNHLANDSQAIVVNPVTTLDRQGNLTLQYATGDQQTYTADYTIPGQPNNSCSNPLGCEQINFLYSIKVATIGGGATQAAVNWYLPFRHGERVSGPITVFNSTFYFATFTPPDPASGAVCGGGTPTLWGLDFEIPAPGCGAGPVGWQAVQMGCGGNPRDFGPTGFQANPLDANGIPTTAVIPGVSIAITPSCTNTSAPSADSYTGGMHTGLSGSTTGSYSLMAQIGGAPNAHTGATNTVSKTVVAPNAATFVDSWASLAE
jgi:type IV pilus assembly protein PilY1